LVLPIDYYILSSSRKMPNIEHHKSKKRNTRDRLQAREKALNRGKPRVLLIESIQSRLPRP